LWSLQPPTLAPSDSFIPKKMGRVVGKAAHPG